ncbi:hypothetical protein DIPPA_12809 [Diplonema papillatum]|nr:hypothetical protein DIPPA_12809 [Diplonema papillatum]|eukprot:gene12069-18645_t
MDSTVAPVRPAPVSTNEQEFYDCGCVEIVGHYVVLFPYSWLCASMVTLCLINICTTFVIRRNCDCTSFSLVLLMSLMNPSLFFLIPQLIVHLLHYAYLIGEVSGYYHGGWLEPLVEEGASLSWWDRYQMLYVLWMNSGVASFMATGCIFPTLATFARRLGDIKRSTLSVHGGSFGDDRRVSVPAIAWDEANGRVAVYAGPAPRGEPSFVLENGEMLRQEVSARDSGRFVRVRWAGNSGYVARTDVRVAAARQDSAAEMNRAAGDPGSDWDVEELEEQARAAPLAADAFFCEMPPEASWEDGSAASPTSATPLVPGTGRRGVEEVPFPPGSQTVHRGGGGETFLAACAQDLPSMEASESGACHQNGRGPNRRPSAGSPPSSQALSRLASEDSLHDWKQRPPVPANHFPDSAGPEAGEIGSVVRTLHSAINSPAGAAPRVRWHAGGEQESPRFSVGGADAAFGAEAASTTPTALLSPSFRDAGRSCSDFMRARTLATAPESAKSVAEIQRTLQDLEVMTGDKTLLQEVGAIVMLVFLSPVIITHAIPGFILYIWVLGPVCVCCKVLVDYAIRMPRDATNQALLCRVFLVTTVAFVLAMVMQVSVNFALFTYTEVPYIDVVAREFNARRHDCVRCMLVKPDLFARATSYFL